MFPQEVSIEAGGKTIRLIDTPGLSWVAAQDQSAEDAARVRARDILTRNKGRIDRLKDPEPVGESNCDSLYDGSSLMYYLSTRDYRSREHARLDAVL